jgi:hypothetical protein
LKLKISLLFSLDQYCKIIILTCLVSLSGKAFSQTNTTPGVIESFERLLDLHKTQFQKNKSEIQSKLKVVSNFDGLSDVKLDPQYVKSLLMHSDERFLKMAMKDECRFLSMLETNLLKTSDGNIDEILISYKNKDNQSDSASMAKKDYFQQIYKKRCLNNSEYSILFADENVQKTVQGIKFTIPRTPAECKNVHNEWLENSFTPYLCRIQQVFKKPSLKKLADYYFERIPLMQRLYLDNLCNNLDNSALFCGSYLKDDIWNKILTSEVPEYKMSYKCQQVLNKKEKLTLQDLRNCASKFSTEDKFCETKGNGDFLSNFPLQSCNNISLALNNSKLVTNYHDCPGNIDNEALTNIHRIVNHFDPRKITTSKETCAGEANYSLAKLNLDIKHAAGWPLKICYLDRVTNKEACTSYIPGSRAEEPLSEDQVVAKILYEQKGASRKTTCRIVDSKTYNPLRTDFKYGCFIVYDTKTCTTYSCEKSVIWDEKNQGDIKFVGIPEFDYFPTAYINERYSFTNLVNEVKGTQERIIRNLTEAKFYLKSVPNGIIHGIGCSEDLVPELFQRSGMNQCHPMPFIIDGFVDQNGNTRLVTRLSIDDLHTPRLLTWPNFYNAVSAYQELHPLNTWTLYGIKK